MTICFMASGPTSELLKGIRTRLGMSQTEFARRLGVPRANYKNWEYGVANAPASVIRDAKALDRPEVSGPTIPASQLYIPIPYIGGVAASSMVDWTDPFESNAFEFVPPEMGDPRGRFACRVLGDSMYDLLMPGDLCVFQSSPVPKIGTVIMYRSPENQVTIKVLKHDGKGFVLHPLNSAYEDCPATGECVGYLVGIVREIGSRKVTVYDSTGIRP